MEEFTDLRDQFLSRVVSGKTFAEVGGLWGTVNERVSVAHKCGATALTMMDAAPEGSELWTRFHERMASLDIHGCSCMSGDICELASSKVPAPYDVIHCSGVLYHHPNPIIMLTALRRITREHLILNSAITQLVYENEKGRYEIPPSGVLFVPALNEQERSILSYYWEGHGVHGLGLTEPCTYDPADFAPWWWLATPQALTAMCVAAGFTVRDSGMTWSGNACTLLLAP